MDKKLTQQLIPECIILSMSIILIVLGSLNYSISPAPENIHVDQLSQYTGRTFCIPITPIENSMQTNQESIQASMNHGYQLMITSIIFGILLCLLSIYRIGLMYYQKPTAVKK